MKRKAVIKHLPTTKKVSLASVHRDLDGKNHRHVCTNQSCRLMYEDNCHDAAVNGRCHFCRGARRPWVYEDGLSGHDPRPCCIDNTVALTEPKDLRRYDCAGPGPWFQCRTCFRTHGHPCTEPDLINRPLAVYNPEGTA